jgi:TraX protein.
MNTYRLKIIAITAMLIDHIGAILISPFTNYWLYVSCRAIGRLAFPIFVFLIVEGFYHTSNIRNYLMRLGAFAVISEIPFDLAFYRSNFGTDIMTDISGMFVSTTNFASMLDRLSIGQNVFFTLFLGLALISLIDMTEKKFKQDNKKDIAISNTIYGLLTITFCAAAFLLKTDYGIAGILMIVAFYLFRGNITLLAISTFIISGTLLSNAANFFRTGNFYDIISILATLAVIPIAFYNGERGKSLKYFFYLFYPVHLLCLFVLSLI